MSDKFVPVHFSIKVYLHLAHVSQKPNVSEWTPQLRELDLKFRSSFVRYDLESLFRHAGSEDELKVMMHYANIIDRACDTA